MPAKSTSLSILQHIRLSGQLRFCLLQDTFARQHIHKMDIRLLHPSDIPHVQTTNITNLPENYFCKYYMYHQLSWPQLSYVAVDVSFSCKETVIGINSDISDPGIETDENTLRCAQDRRLRTRKDGGGSSRRHPTRPHHISQCYAHTQKARSCREAHAPKP
jgi:hypothetical protein